MPVIVHVLTNRFSEISSFYFSGGQLCQIGNQWVVNPDGGLESKGIFLCFYLMN